MEQGTWTTRSGAIAFSAVLLAAAPSPAASQSLFVVEGRVVEPGGAGVPNAIVSIDGSRPTLTADDGRFAFEAVEAGLRTLGVEAFGYVAASLRLDVRGDTAVAVVLDIAPFVLDSLVVAPRRIEVRGRVRGAGRDRTVEDAEVTASQGQEDRTNARGDFGFDAWEAVPLLLRVRAFGYLPLDTVISPEGEDGRRELFLDVDPLVERMMATEIRRIEERAGGRLAVTMRPMDREELLRRPGSTLRELLEFRYPLRIRRIGCVVVDERALAPGMAAGVLETTLARDVERLEFLYDGGMLRVYTREFMRRMLGSGTELVRPLYVDMAHPPMCR